MTVGDRVGVRNPAHVRFNRPFRAGPAEMTEPPFPRAHWWVRWWEHRVAGRAARKVRATGGDAPRAYPREVIERFRETEAGLFELAAGRRDPELTVAAGAVVRADIRVRSGIQAGGDMLTPEGARTARARVERDRAGRVFTQAYARWANRCASLRWQAEAAAARANALLGYYERMCTRHQDETDFDGEPYRAPRAVLHQCWNDLVTLLDSNEADTVHKAWAVVLDDLWPSQAKGEPCDSPE